MTMIRIAGVVNDSVVDGPGIRYTVFTQGCEHNCKGCHNVHTHDRQGGYDIAVDDLLEQVRNNPLLDGITLSGGEPFLQPKACAELATKVHDMGLNVFSYTGYTFEQLLRLPDMKELLEAVDILVDGPYVEGMRSLSLKFRGSRNQRVIDVKKSMEQLKVVEIEW
ncbi:MAG TPA: anaerobic ribonucleoside-triphosphate reductase activating protein [Lachnospiraceae bacterium]|nr:anaerobic ribonucleoside-triphosphate reductase activating protein [Lachnospiraceae bacterium]